MSTPSEVTLLRALTAAARAFLKEVESDTSPPRADPPDSSPAALDKWDPLYDPPPFPADPTSTAIDARDQKDMAVIAFLGGIARVNAEFGRGATSDEIRQFARNGGYTGGAAVNGWNSNPRAKGAIEVRGNKRRFLNAAGHEHLRSAIQRQARRLRVIGDMAPIDIPED